MPSATTAASTGTTTSSTMTTTVEPSNWFLYLTDDVSLILDGKGQSKWIGMTFEPGTELQGSCSIVWRGKAFVFGGFDHFEHQYQRQISIVNECKLTRKGELPFDMKDGACAQRDNRELFICFESKSYLKTCRRSNGPFEDFTNLPNSTYDHARNQIAANSGELCLLTSLGYSGRNTETRSIRLYIRLRTGFLTYVSLQIESR